MDTKQIIKHLENTLELSSELFLETLSILFKKIKDNSLKFLFEEKYSLLNCLVKYSILKNMPLSTGVLKDTINLLNYTDGNNSRGSEIEKSIVTECVENEIIQSGSGSNATYELLSNQVKFYKKFNL